jgi:mannose-6-phosphate isomerase-like protein (cupin superfamily)
MYIETIEYNNERLAYIIRKSIKVDGKKFFGSPDDFLQIGYMNLKKGEILKPHIHKPQKKLITKNQEVLYIVSGKMKVSFYDKIPKKINEALLSDGDLIVLLSGGHGFEFLEDTELIEIKQGPYTGKSNDKTIFGG